MNIGLAVTSRELPGLAQSAEHSVVWLDRGLCFLPRLSCKRRILHLGIWVGVSGRTTPVAKPANVNNIMLRLSSSSRHRRTYRRTEGAGGGTREIAYDGELTCWIAIPLAY